ncbi:MAG: phage holin family protein [Shimia sp.]
MNDQTSPRSTPGLVSDVLTHVSNLVRKEFDLARAEMDQNITRAVVAIGLLVGAVVIALTALNVLAAALVAAIENTGIAAGWAALIVGVIFAAIAAGLAAKGANDLKASSLAPTRTMDNIKQDAETVKESV